MTDTGTPNNAAGQVPLTSVKRVVSFADPPLSQVEPEQVVEATAGAYADDGHGAMDVDGNGMEREPKGCNIHEEWVNEGVRYRNIFITEKEQGVQQAKPAATDPDYATFKEQQQQQVAAAERDPVYQAFLAKRRTADADAKQKQDMDQQRQRYADAEPEFADFLKQKQEEEKHQQEQDEQQRQKSSSIQA